MCWDAIMQEVRREHHVVSLVPELGVILVIELQDVSNTDESETWENENSQPEPHKEGGVVEGTLWDTDKKTRENWSECSEDVIDLNPVEVDNLECAAKSMLRVLSLTHLKRTCDLTNESGSLGEALIHDELQCLESAALQEPWLKSLRHFFLLFLLLNY